MNVVGGSAVLASYVWGLGTQPEPDRLWGDLPAGLQPLYQVNMFLAAAGYFPFTAFLWLRVDPGRARVAGRLGFGLFNALYAAILITSALWTPLTFAYLATPSAALWGLIRTVLLLCGLASLALFPALLTLRGVERGTFFGLALVGLAFFCLQTAVLDALVWPVFFPALHG